MLKRIQCMAMVTAAGALLAVPAVGQAHHKPGHTHGGGNGQSRQGEGEGQNGQGHRCVVNKGFVVKGILVSYTPDNTSTTNVNEQSVTLTVTKMNRHARRSGLTDVNTSTPGTQYRINAGGTGADPFSVRLSDFEPNETPAAGDRVVVVGKVAVTKRKCAPNASLDDRYGDVDVRRVNIIDAD